MNMSFFLEDQEGERKERRSDEGEKRSTPSL